MKNLLYLLLIVSAIISSCAKDNIDEVKSDESQVEIAVEEAIQAVLIEDILKSVDAYSDFGDNALKSVEIMEEECLTISVKRLKDGQAWPREITLEFGENCPHNDKVKSGKIIIVKTDKWRNPGSVREVSFENYIVDGVAIEGHKRIENITQEGGYPTFQIEVNLELTTPESESSPIKIVKRKAEKIQVWEEGIGDRKVKNVYLVTGNANISISKGDKEKVVRKEFDALRIVQGCKFPQEGTTAFNVNTFDEKKLVFSLDYGISLEEKDCDCMATILWNKESEEINLCDRWWKKARETEKDKKNK